MLGGEQVEGRQAVRELLRAGTRRVREVWLAEGIDEADAVADITAAARQAGIPVRPVGRGRLDAAAGTSAPQGVLAFAEPVPEAELADLARRRVGGPPPFLLVLDGVTDPHNLGALLRTALCAGATGAVLGRHRSAHLTPAAVKAAVGAVEYLPIALVSGVPAALAELKAAGVWTVGLDGGGDQPLWGLEVAIEPVAIVLGAEGRGLARLTGQRCDVVVQVPTQGPLGSLNVAAAGALACFEVARRRRL
ncbi:MAG TPA: 23S rRNA (guanosine(2251)-2'-O)-methyltransferase RlmB [Acidimicrobiales bacterium]|nr:23S rRNA (guanosine(2251)-2'-O)-methyltransferase RlmB [Acidimicrobiales bacterium]